MLELDTNGDYIDALIGCQDETFDLSTSRDQLDHRYVTVG